MWKHQNFSSSLRVNAWMVCDSISNTKHLEYLANMDFRKFILKFPKMIASLKYHIYGVFSITLEQLLVLRSS